MLEFSIYLLYRAASAVVRALPLPALFHVGQIGGFCAWLAFRAYRRLARQNLLIAFPNEKSSRELRRLTRRHFQRLGANLLCSIKLSGMSVDRIAARVQIENLDAVHRELRAGRGVVVALSHLASWELMAQLMPKYIGYVRNSTVYQRLRNRYIDADIRRERGRAGVEMFDRQEGFHKPIELLRVGGVIGILSDQHAGDHGIWTPFFGRLASTSPLSALLAKRTGAALITAAVYTAGVARWRVVFSDPINLNADSVPALTARVNELIAAQIREAPEDWFWVHNRWKTPTPNFLLARYKRGVFLRSDAPTQELQPFRILIRASNWLGDSIMSVPAVRAIKAGRPDAHITVAAPEKIAEVWKLVPEVDKILPLSRSALVGAVRALRRAQRFDVAILFPNSLRVALEAWLAGVPRRVGYSGHRRNWLLNQIVQSGSKLGPPEHQAEHYLRIAHQVGANPTAGQEPARTKKERAVNSATRIGLCAGAEYGRAKRWLPERFAEVAARVASQAKVQWILFGTPAEAGMGSALAEKIGENCTNLVGRTTLEELVEELRRCALLLTNDTGTMHLAAFINVPVVALFGSTEPRLTGPLGAGHRVIRHHVECSPCFLRDCPIDFRCMHAISVAEVVAVITAKLSEVTSTS
ncbi:MAG: lipopolysaccharide heptosyltransferase II [Chthoniobacterales bacterium]